ncbi:hypothetical protein [Ancylobacter rudongensis]|uniref:Calpain catalytic domain-containing protein n=1 Tax=Ancylobacter rudongensis TaxID=177413 RepID=A0A1G4PC52_9HYPH|nr:hypothetical protein [Ancylobacter rudongensis]SCW29892.1 hypothetical protein SAMN05660859_0462 [Ancylobacter rudongensis]
MAKFVIDAKSRNGLLKYKRPNIAAPAAPVPFAHWSNYQFEDRHLPSPDAKHGYVPVEEPLFNASIDFKDLKQERVGDCYLLSAINALIRTRHPSFFLAMMGSTRTHVHVRFFAPRGAGFTPVIVSVQRTILKEIRGSGHADMQGHGAIWPYFIEKAYAFFRVYYLQYLLNQDLIPLPVRPAPLPAPPPWPFPHAVQPVPPARLNARYAVDYKEALEGGFSDLAYTHLCGRPMQEISERFDFVDAHGVDKTIDQRVYRAQLLRFVLDETLPSPFAEAWDVTLGRFLAPLHRTLANLTTPLVGPALPPNADMILQGAIQQHILQTRANNRRAISRLVSMLESNIDLIRETRTSDIRRITSTIIRNNIDLSLNGMANIDFGDLIDRYVAVSFPGKRGTGEYTDYQQRIFDRITAVCGPNVGNRAAFASTRNIFKINNYYIIRKAIEGMHKGLASGHDYEVSGVDTMNIKRNGAEARLKFVLIRNPWRDYVRSYKFNMNEPGNINPTRSLSGVEVAKVDDLSEDPLTKLRNQAKGLADDVRKMQAELSRSARTSAAFPVELSDITKFFDLLDVEA